MKKSIFKKISAFVVVLSLILATESLVFATSYKDGKYTNSITRNLYSSYYTMTGVMKVTNGMNSNEEIRVRLRRQKSNGNYAGWREQSSSNAISLRVDVNGLTNDGSRGWQGGFKANSLKKESNSNDGEIRHYYSF